MSGSLDEVYFRWLYRFLAPLGDMDPSQSYWQLAEQLHQTVFTWHIRNDENRSEDGIALRRTFQEEEGLHLAENSEWMTQPCSILEMLIALSGRTAFDSYGSASDWIHVLLRNLEIGHLVDGVYHDGVRHHVDEVLSNLVHRNYGVDGVGGLFPLRLPAPDQRKIEIRYQMAAYVLEGEHVANGP